MKLFKKPKSKSYWYDFTVRGRHYRASTQETKSVRAQQIASLKLASVMERTDPLPTKPVVLQEFANRFLDWVNDRRNPPLNVPINFVEGQTHFPLPATREVVAISAFHPVRTRLRQKSGLGVSRQLAQLCGNDLDVCFVQSAVPPADASHRRHLITGLSRRTSVSLGGRCRSSARTLQAVRSDL